MGCTLHLLPFIRLGSPKVTKYMTSSFNVSSILWLMNSLLDLYLSSGRLLYYSLQIRLVSISLAARPPGQNLPMLISFDSLSLCSAVYVFWYSARMVEKTLTTSDWFMSYLSILSPNDWRRYLSSKALWLLGSLTPDFNIIRTSRW